MDIKIIHLSWRQGRGEERFLVGVLKRTENNVTFQYDKENVEKAKKEGFINYPDFPDTDSQNLYTGDLKSIFSLRLMPATRPDRMAYLSFWEYANQPNNDWFNELAFTQGRLATDNFEFLAEFPYHEKGLRFVTDIASLSHRKIPSNLISIEDLLRFEAEPNNPIDPSAIKVFKGDEHIGYIKKGHNLFFKEANSNRILLKVKYIEKNGLINQIYIVVSKLAYYSGK